jgi:NADH:ubiquinone oxidoreductase subunit 2 (subunit N)
LKKTNLRESTATMSRIRTVTILAIAAVVVGSAWAQNKTSTKAPKMLPYTTVDHPQFVPASEASFLSNADVVIGVSSSGVAKAYPGADLAQHGVVQDKMPDGPIAVTW